MRILFSGIINRSLNAADCFKRFSGAAGLIELFRVVIRLSLSDGFPGGHLAAGDLEIFIAGQKTVKSMLPNMT